MKYNELKQRLITILIKRGIIAAENGQKAFEELEDKELINVMEVFLEVINEYSKEIISDYELRIEHLEQEIYVGKSEGEVGDE